MSPSAVSLLLWTSVSIRNKNLNFGGVSKSIIHASLVLVGAQFEDGEPLLFNRFQFSVEGLDEWLAISGIKVEHDFKARTATIRYEPPEEIAVNLPGDIRMAFTFGWTLPSGGDPSEAKVTQKAYVRFESDRPREFDEFRALAFRINNLLCLAIDRTVTLDSVTVYSEEINHKSSDGREYPVPVEVYYSSLPYSEERPKIEWHRMFFRYQHVADDLEGKITAWIEAYERLEPAFNLYFAARSGANRYLDGRFLSLTQGLETFHRRTSDERQMAKDEFLEIVDSVVEACPDDRREWLLGRLTYANELTLRDRLKQLFDAFPDHFGSGRQRKALVGKIVDTRNYLTHYDQRLESRACTGRDLWEVCTKLECLFALYLLNAMNLDKAEIGRIVNDNYSFKQKLGTT